MVDEEFGIGEAVDAGLRARERKRPDSKLDVQQYKLSGSLLLDLVSERFKWLAIVPVLPEGEGQQRQIEMRECFMFSIGEEDLCTTKTGPRL